LAKIQPRVREKEWVYIKIGITDRVVLDALDATFGNNTELATGAYPEFRVDLVVGDYFALEDMAGEEVVVHRVGDDFGYC
jgi:hypothetical protein